MTEPLLVAKSKSSELSLLPALANRHGLIAGATGTGKTVTLQTLAQGFSRIGVPVFMADVKGDLSGLALAKGAARTIGSQIGREVVRGVLGSILGGGGKRRR
jgi:DNA helicase HerA-like ATPase